MNNEISLLSDYIFGAQADQLCSHLKPATANNIYAYRNNFMLQISNLFQDYYPNLYVVLGKKNFKNEVIKYTSDHPTNFDSLDHYGQYFYQQGFSPNATEQDFLSSIAQLDYVFFHPFAPSTGIFEIDLNLLTYYLEDRLAEFLFIKGERIKISHSLDQEKNIILNQASTQTR